MSKRDWLVKQPQAFEALRGKTVSGWAGTEMALAEGDDGQSPIWQDDRVPLLQFSVVHVIFREFVAVIDTTQDDDQWSLSCAVAATPGLPSFDQSSIFRVREIPELPVGAIDNVHVKQLGHNIASVELAIQGRRVTLSAGEVYEQLDGTFTVVDSDESVLLQVDGRRPTLPSSGQPSAAAHVKRYNEK